MSAFPFLAALPDIGSYAIHHREQITNVGQ